MRRLFVLAVVALLMGAYWFSRVSPETPRLPEPSRPETVEEAPPVRNDEPPVVATPLARHQISVRIEGVVEGEPPVDLTEQAVILFDLMDKEGRCTERRSGQFLDGLSVGDECLILASLPGFVGQDGSDTASRRVQAEETSKEYVVQLLAKGTATFFVRSTNESYSPEFLVACAGVQKPVKDGVVTFSEVRPMMEQSAILKYPTGGQDLRFSIKPGENFEYHWNVNVREPGKIVGRFDPPREGLLSKKVVVDWSQRTAPIEGDHSGDMHVHPGFAEEAPIDDQVLFEFGPLGELHLGRRFAVTCIAFYEDRILVASSAPFAFTEPRVFDVGQLEPSTGSLNLAYSRPPWLEEDEPLEFRVYYYHERDPQLPYSPIDSSVAFDLTPKGLRIDGLPPRELRVSAPTSETWEHTNLRIPATATTYTPLWQKRSIEGDDPVAAAFDEAKLKRVAELQDELAKTTDPEERSVLRRKILEEVRKGRGN